MPTPQEKVAQAIRGQQGLSWRQGSPSDTAASLYGTSALAAMMTPGSYDQKIRTSPDAVSGLSPNDYGDLNLQANYLPAFLSWLQQQVSPLAGQPIEPITPR